MIIFFYLFYGTLILTFISCCVFCFYLYGLEILLSIENFYIYEIFPKLKKIINFLAIVIIQITLRLLWPVFKFLEKVTKNV